MISSKDKETLKKHLIDAIDIVENESCGLDTFFNESTEAKEDNLSSFQSTKVEGNLENDENAFHHKLDTGQEAEFIECIENIENLQSELDIFSKSLHTLMENRIGAHKQPVDGEVEKPNAENNVTRPSHGGTEPVKQLSPDNTDGKSGDRDYEDMEDHSRETEFERQNDEEKKMYLCAEEYNKAKEEADLYKRKPIPDPNSPEEIPKEIQIDEPQYWDFSEDDWRKRVAFEKRMVNGECKKFGR